MCLHVFQIPSQCKIMGDKEGLVGGRLQSQGSGGKGTSPAVVPEPLPALPAPAAIVEQI